jgi:hypothetical protein
MYLLDDFLMWALASPLNVGLAFIIVGLVIAVFGVLFALWLDSYYLGGKIIEFFGCIAIACVIVGCADLLIVVVYGLIT